MQALRSLVHLCNRAHGSHATRACLEERLGRSLDSGPSEKRDGDAATSAPLREILQPQRFAFSKVTSWADELEDEEEQAA